MRKVGLVSFGHLGGAGRLLPRVEGEAGHGHGKAGELHDHVLALSKLCNQLTPLFCGFFQAEAGEGDAQGAANVVTYDLCAWASLGQLSELCQVRVEKPRVKGQPLLCQDLQGLPEGRELGDVLDLPVHGARVDGLAPGPGQGVPHAHEVRRDLAVGLEALLDGLAALRHVEVRDDRQGLRALVRDLLDPLGLGGRPLLVRHRPAPFVLGVALQEDSGDHAVARRILLELLVRVGMASLPRAKAVVLERGHQVASRSLARPEVVVRVNDRVHWLLRVLLGQRTPLVQVATDLVETIDEGSFRRSHQPKRQEVLLILSVHDRQHHCLASGHGVPYLRRPEVLVAVRVARSPPFDETCCVDPALLRQG
mmetsp:Transcript_45202/g.130948  ORF Transcript_45202/g.130948 Transcript_45202/m.130948 type:complete len:366 (+) Transcript_45202:322-1419(+)